MNPAQIEQSKLQKVISITLRSGVLTASVVGIAGGAADQRHVDGKGLVAQPALAIDFHQLDQIVRGDAVEFAAFAPRMDAVPRGRRWAAPASMSRLASPGSAPPIVS